MRAGEYERYLLRNLRAELFLRDKPISLNTLDRRKIQWSLWDCPPPPRA